LEKWGNSLLILDDWQVASRGIPTEEVAMMEFNPGRKKKHLFPT